MSGRKRLLAAIMFTDIVGYTARMGMAEEESLEIIRINRELQQPLVKKYGGIWLKEMGDGILARFESALNAVLCAIEIQQTIGIQQDFHVRIGIHLGDIVIENEDVYGDGVNIASRLQSIADPGGIYISESIINAIRGRDEVQYIDLGPVILKNVNYQVRTYAVQGEGLPVPAKRKMKTIKSRSSENRIKRNWKTILIIILLLLSLTWIFRHSIFVKDLAKITSLAVLPFDNLTHDPEQEYLMAGMHDALITELSKISALRIISRQSTLRFSGSKLPMPEIAKQLGVDAIVEASVLRVADSARIQVQLIKTFPNESHILAHNYHYSLKDVLKLYSEITRDIANRINVQLTAGEKTRMLDTRQVNPEAYESYLKGTFHWNKLTLNDLLLAEKYFQKSIELDPDYAQAYAGLAITGLAHAQMGYDSFLNAALKSMKFLEKALEIDSTLSEVYYVNAIFNTWGLWDFEKAGSYYRKALDLNPNYAIARAYYSHYLLITNNTEEAIIQIEKALQLDPFNELYKGLYGMVLLNSRKYDNARQYLEDLVKESPDNRIGLTTLRSVYHQKKMFEEAFRIWKITNANDTAKIGALEKGYKEGGYKKALLLLGELLEKRSVSDYVPAWQIGTIYTRAGMKEKAIFWLKKAYDEHDPNMPYIRIDPIFDDLRDDPAFKVLVDRMNFPG